MTCFKHNPDSREFEAYSGVNVCVSIRDFMMWPAETMCVYVSKYVNVSVSDCVSVNFSLQDSWRCVNNIWSWGARP